MAGDDCQLDCEQEQLRDTAETARAANEQNRGAAEAARHAVVDGVQAAADATNPA